MTNAEVTHTGTAALRTHFEAYFRCSLLRAWQSDLTRQWLLTLAEFYSGLQKLRALSLKKAILFAQCVVIPTAEHLHSETRREYLLIPARTCNQTMILKSQHTLFAHLHSFQLNTDNWHSHWVHYQQAGSNWETMALGKEESTRKQKPLQDQAWRELHVYVPNQEVRTDLGITASLLSLPVGTESTVLRRNTAASNLI